MEERIFNQKKVQFLGEEYLVYLKEVPTKLGTGGAVEATTIRAFVRKVKQKKRW